VVAINSNTQLSTIKSERENEITKETIEEEKSNNEELNDSLNEEEGVKEQDSDQELERYMKSNEKIKITKLKLIGSGT
jgi:hypothetical protein